MSLPRLDGFDWRVDVKTSSDCATRMAAPTCLLEMKVGTELWNEGLKSDRLFPLQVCRGRESTGHLLPPQTVTMEFSRETLHTMLDGLGKIRDQLASVATK